MAFYCITREGESNSNKYLKAACKKRGIEYVELYGKTFDYTQKIPLTKNDLLYRVSTGTSERILENYLVDGTVTTFYQHQFPVRFPGIPAHQRNDISIPTTIMFAGADRKRLSAYVDHLGGFPIVIKVTGGSHGIGVMKLDSMSSLLSVVDYLNSRNERFILRQFIDVRGSARLIVLGKKVVDSYEYLTGDDDFRSNVGEEPTVVKKKFSVEIQKTAIKAVQLIGVEFGGVDILIDSDGKYYVAEVNYPCYFPRAQGLTGVDTAGMMVDYLVKKSKRRR